MLASTKFFFGVSGSFSCELLSFFCIIPPFLKEVARTRDGGFVSSGKIPPFQ